MTTECAYGSVEWSGALTVWTVSVRYRVKDAMVLTAGRLKMECADDATEVSGAKSSELDTVHSEELHMVYESAGLPVRLGECVSVGISVLISKEKVKQCYMLLESGQCIGT